MKFAISFELDNAESIDDISLVLLSIESIIVSASKFVGKVPSTTFALALIRSDYLSQPLTTSLAELRQKFSKIDFLDIANSAGSYFGAKNASLALAEETDVVIFCDSDSVYAADFIENLLEGLSEPGVGVVFGKTYPQTSKASKFEDGSALWWQFPPRELGYGNVWGNSMWMNNFAVRSSVFLENPFQEISLERGRNRKAHQIKVEGVLWKQHLQREGILFHSVEAYCAHRVFSSLNEFSDRQFDHGLASAFMSSYQGRGSLYAILSPLGEPIRRLFGLTRLVLQGRLGGRKFFSSLPFFLCSIIWRLGGSVSLKKSNVSVKSRLAKPSE